MSALGFDAVVAGGGFAGAVAAASLADAGLEVAVIDPRERASESALRGELLHPRAVAFLAKLGLEDSLRTAGAVDVRGFAAWSSHDPNPVILPYGDRPGLGLKHAVIVDRLRAAISARRRIHFRTGRARDVLRARDAVVGLRCADGTTYSARLVIAADGRYSRLRPALGIRATGALLSHSVGTTIDARHLPVPGHGHVFVGGPGPVVIYPFGGRSARVNIDVPLDAPRGRDALVAYVTRRYAPHVTPPVFEAIRTALATQPLLGAANHVVAARSCAVRGAVLLGDAGGCSHPLTATGMTSAVHDAMTLTSAILDQGNTERALVAYQKGRYPFVRAREAFAQALYDVFRGDDVGTRALRDGVFRYWQRPRARRVSMAILAGDESRTCVFIAEYARVVMAAAVSALAASAHDCSFAASAAAVSGLTTAAKTSVRLAFDHVATAVRSRSLESSAEVIRSASMNGSMNGNGASSFRRFTDAFERFERAQAELLDWPYEWLTEEP